MALIPCPHCGKEISSYAKRCPGCGKTLDQTTEKVDKKNDCPEPTAEHEVLDSKVDYKKIFSITEDEFEGNKSVGVRFDINGNPEMDCLSEKIHAKKPSIVVIYTASALGNYFAFAYYEEDLLNKIKEHNINEYDKRIGTPCRGLIINIDGAENIKLNAVSDNPYFIINQATDQEQFLQCCKARSLEFKVFKNDGSPIVIKGAEEDQEIFIDYLRALYNYIVDSSTFPDAGFKAQKWVNEHSDELQGNNEATNTNTKTHKEEKTDVDYRDIFDINNDEFDGVTMVNSVYGMSGNPELDSFSKRIYAVEPQVQVFHFSQDGDKHFFVRYDESDLVEELGENDIADVDPCIGSPCKGIIITINGNETIKLNSEKGNPWVEISQEQFLKCCNAHNIEFKIFKQEGSPIVIRGTKEDEELMIASFQSLYRYIVNKSMFADSWIKIKKWQDKLDKELEEKKKELEDLKRGKAEKDQNRKNIGIVLTVFGALFFIISFFCFDNIGTFFTLFLLGTTLVIVGSVMISYCNMKKKVQHSRGIVDNK